MKRGDDRRKLERRKGKRGVTSRIGDIDPDDNKRVRRNMHEVERKKKSKQ